MDVVSTKIALNRGAVELNPIFGQSWTRILGLNGLIIAAILYFSVDIEKESSPMVFASAVRCGAAAHNFWIVG